MWDASTIGGGLVYYNTMQASEAPPQNVQCQDWSNRQEDA